MDEKRQNREFKFRAYDTKNKKWLHEYETMGGFSLKGEIVVFHELWNGISLTTLLEYVVIMQYTGLKDKNGKEIYEGDIVRMYCQYDDVDPVTVQVKFTNGGFTVEASGWFYGGECDITTVGWAIQDGNQFEVIGNIYENHELSES